VASYVAKREAAKHRDITSYSLLFAHTLLIVKDHNDINKQYPLSYLTFKEQSSSITANSSQSLGWPLWAGFTVYRTFTSLHWIFGTKFIEIGQEFCIKHSRDTIHVNVISVHNIWEHPAQRIKVPLVFLSNILTLISVLPSWIHPGTNGCSLFACRHCLISNTSKVIPHLFFCQIESQIASWEYFYVLYW